MYNYYIDYGYVNIKLKEKMNEKNISIHKMSRMINVSYDIVKKYYYGTNTLISMEILAKFCFVLECKIEDILEYVPAEIVVK